MSCQDSSAAIANFICCIQVLQHHYRTSNLELQLCQWKCSTVNLIQILHRIVKQWVIVTQLLRGWKEVNTGKELCWTREPCKNCLIELIHLLVHARENDALREVLIRMVGDVDARINGVNERVNSVLCTAELIWKRDVARVICMFPMAHF